MAELADIYKAAGAEIRDGKIIMTSSPQPFDIVVRVVPSSIEWNAGQQAKIGFSLVLDDEYAIGNEGGLGRYMEHIEHDGMFEIPVDQVRLLSEVKSE